MVLFGLGVGILVGMTGVGGGSIMTPLLILVFGVKPVLAVGTDLAYAAVTKTVGGFRHFKQGTVDLPMAAWMGIGSVPGALGGVALLEAFEQRYGADLENPLIVALACALLLTGIATVGRAALYPALAERETDTVHMDRRNKVKAVVLGLAVGVVLGVTSAGSGALIAVGLIMMFRLTPRRVVGTDVFHAAGLLWAAAIGHLVGGNIDFGLMGNLLLGSVPGIWIGSGLTTKVPIGFLRPLLGAVLTFAGVALLAKAGASWFVIAAAAFVAGLTVAAPALLRRRRATLPDPA